MEELLNELTQGISTPSKAAVVLARLAWFRTLPSDEQEKELPRMYLHLERYLTEVDPLEKHTREQLRHLIPLRFPALLHSPRFHLIFQPPTLQEIFLCRDLLNVLLGQIYTVLGATQGDILAAVHRWLNGVPDSPSLPLPLGLAGPLPSHEEEWIGLLGRLGRALHLWVEGMIGEKAAASIYERSYQEVTDIFGTLETVAAVIGLLPDQLLDEQKLSLLSRRQIERVLLEKNDHLQKINEALSFKNKELEKIQKALAEEKERLAVTLRCIGDGVITTTTDGKIILMNQTAERLTGWVQEAVAGRPLAEVFQVVDEKTRRPRESLLETFLKRDLLSGAVDDLVLRSKDGAERMIAPTGAPLRDRKEEAIGMVLVLRDVTEKKKMEEELLKASKLESIAVLTAGLAHDFNNLLTGVLGNISLIKRSTSAEDPIFKRLTEAENASIRARDLTWKLLAFSQGERPLKRNAFVQTFIKESAALATIGSSVRCELFFPSDLWPVEIDAVRIGQVFHILIVNAVEAMPEGGCVEIFAENVEASAPRPFSLGDGRYIKVSIRDHGMGIPSENLGKIFDPYFTTKKNWNRKGSGLGLALAYSIIKKHNGSIMVASTLGVGTVFEVYLPALGEVR